MVSLTLKHSIRWQAPIPLWAENSSTGLRITNAEVAPQPSILRFATDSFMEEMLAMLQDNPKRIGEWVAQAETWREPMKTPRQAAKKTETSSISFLLNKTKQLTEQRQSKLSQPVVKLKDTHVPVKANAMEQAIPLKLFQSTHQRYYLVSASLISRKPGLPDRLLNLSKNEKTSFVVRRLAPPEDDQDKQSLDAIETWDEYAFVLSASGGKWQKLDRYNQGMAKTLADNEEQLPLFPVSFKDSCGHDRKIHSGLIPVGKRETWMGAPAEATADSQESGRSYAKALFQADVAAPWKALVSQGRNKNDSLSRSFDSFETSGDAGAETDRARRTLRDTIQTASWYILLDFANFLRQYLPAVWAVINHNASADSLDTKEVQFLDALQSVSLTNVLRQNLVRLPDKYTNLGLDCNTLSVRYCVNDVKTELLAALREITDWEEKLESVEHEFIRYDNDDPIAVDENWPDFLFPLSDPELSGPLPDQISGFDYSGLSGVDLDHARIDALAELIEQMLPAPGETEDIFSAQTVLDQREAWFVIRCVYERPLCGPLFPALVSHPTRAFQLAPFFDPDAPARPIRIPMPVDVSPAGLRKFKKNTAFVISDMLCGKIKKIRKITLGDLVLSVLPWPFHKDLPNPGETGPCQKNGVGFGMICSLSIPIVTLCALILVMIMVSLFDLFFRWIPFFILCLPIPGLKGKKGG